MIVVALLSAAITSALGAMIWNQVANTASILQASASELGEEDAGYWAAIQQEIEADQSRHKRDVALTMAAACIALVVVLSLFSVVMTHRVAGPLFKVSRYIEQLTHGQLGNVTNLRRGDLLVDFYGKFRDMNEALRARRRAEVELYRRVVQACDRAEVGRAGALGAAIDDLAALERRRRTALD